MSTIARYNWEEKVLDPATGETIAVSHKNDIFWDSSTGDLATCDGYEEYAQTIEAVVKTVYGELVTNREYGIPYFTTIFNDRRHNDAWEAAVRAAVHQLSFVQSIRSFEYQYDDVRHYLTYRMEVVVSDGTTVVAEG